jgi:hypothetical protein
VHRFQQVARPIYIDRIVYATITLMSVLIIYDGWQHLRLVDVVGVIVGPVVAMFVGHTFAAFIAQQSGAERSLTNAERAGIVGAELPFLLLCVPPLAIVSILFAAGVSLASAIQVTLWFGVGTLGLWGFVASRRAGYSGWKVVVGVAAGLIIGLVVLLLQVILQPGKAFSGGEAVGFGL